MQENEPTSLPATSGKNEVERSIPLILQYLQAVDFMTTDYSPNKTGRGDYLDIHFFTKDESQSRAQILRLVIEYQDYIGLQDEVWLRSKNYAYQFNAKRNLQGEYMQYHEPEGEGRSHLEEAVRIINELKVQDGSLIMIDHHEAFVSRGGVWESTTPFQRKNNPPLPSPNNMLQCPNQ